MRRKNGIGVAIMSFVILAAWAIGQAGEESQDRVKSAQRAEGLILSRCAVCHSTDLIAQQRMDRQHWEATIQKMVRWGAIMSPEEVLLLADYVSARFNPNAPDQEPISRSGAADGGPAI